MWKWFRWVLLAIGIIILLIGIALYGYYYVWMKMSSKMISNAETAFSNGISIDDSKGDFVMMGTDKEEVMSTDKNNPSPYQVDYLDIKSGQFGADDDYLYFRIKFYAKIPKWPESVSGDRLLNIGDKLHIMTKDGVEQVVVHSDFGWEPVIKIPASNTSYDYCPTGIEWPESARMSCNGRDSKIAGGGGTDYIMGALPLKKLGLKAGETLYLSLDEESKSNKFTHAAVDMLAGTGKMAAVVAWEVGTNKFTLDNNFTYQSTADKK